MEIKQRLGEIFGEIKSVMDGLSPAEFVDSCNEIISVRRIFLAGAGRSGLIVRMFAMRLAQAGLTAYVAGDCTTPAIGSGDLLVVASGSGSTRGIMALVEKARSVGARILGITYTPGSPLDDQANVSVLLPVPIDRSRPGMVGGTQVLGTLFDQSLQLTTTLIVEEVCDRLGEDDHKMQYRHANLE